MKKIIITLVGVIAFAIPSKSQKKYERKSTEIIQLFDSIKPSLIETEDGFRITKIIAIPNMPKDRIFNAAIEALSNIYKDSKEVIQSKDKEDGIIIGKGLFFESSMSTWGVLTESKCNHAIKIEIKDYKLRVSIQTDFIENTVKNGVTGQTMSKNSYRLKSFFPFWKECPLKRREASFSNIWFCYSHAIGVINLLEKEIETICNNTSNEW